MYRIFSVLVCSTACAFAQKAPPPFDVASIKPNHSVSGGISMGTSHGRLTAANVSLRMLIEHAYGVKNFQISGGPQWLGMERYDIAAKMEHSGISDDDLWLSLQPLLVERFKLRIHRDTKQLPFYSLAAAKAGPKLQPHSGEGSPSIRSSAGSGKAMIQGSRASMPRFADTLAYFLDYTVVDDTGLGGEYDFKLEWAQDHSAEATAAGNEVGPSLFTAIQEQLGLKLEPKKGPVAVIVVDAAEKPAAN